MPARTSRIGPGPQSRMFASLNVAAVALGAARVREEDADPVRREQLELQDRRPAVERVRAAVDLGDERGRQLLGEPGPVRPARAQARYQPWIRRPSTVDPALDRLAQLDLGEGVVVQVGQPARRAGRRRRAPTGR